VLDPGGERIAPRLGYGPAAASAGTAAAAAWEGPRCRGRTVWPAREHANAGEGAAKDRPTAAAKRSSRPRRAKQRRPLAVYRRPGRVAAALVTGEVVGGLPVRVVEHLRPERPERGLSWSRRTHRQRSYWVRGQASRRLSGDAGGGAERAVASTLARKKRSRRFPPGGRCGRRAAASLSAGPAAKRLRVSVRTGEPRTAERGSRRRIGALVCERAASGR